MVRGVGTLALLFLVSLASPSPSPILFKVEMTPAPGTLVVRPYVSPAFNIETSPKVTLPKVGEVLSCVQEETTQRYGDHSDDFVVLACGPEKRKYILKGVYFGK